MGGESRWALTRLRLIMAYTSGAAGPAALLPVPAPTAGIGSLRASGGAGGLALVVAQTDLCAAGPAPSPPPACPYRFYLLEPVGGKSGP